MSRLARRVVGGLLLVLAVVVATYVIAKQFAVWVVLGAGLYLAVKAVLRRRKQP